MHHDTVLHVFWIAGMEGILWLKADILLLNNAFLSRTCSGSGGPSLRSPNAWVNPLLPFHGRYAPGPSRNAPAVWAGIIMPALCAIPVRNPVSAAPATLTTGMRSAAGVRCAIPSAVISGRKNVLLFQGLPMSATAAQNVSNAP